MEDPSAGIYSIGAVSRMVGVERATLRNWEERFAIVRPQRSPGGQRLFSRADVEQLGFVARLVADGISPAVAHQRLQEHLEQQPRLGLEDQRDPPSFQLLVLLAERDRLAANLTEFFLNTEGYQVVSVFDASEALGLYSQLRPRLVIVDLLISTGAGLQLCRSLKADAIPALLAISTLETREQAIDAGADAFLLKPVDPLQLVSTVKDLLGTSALVRTSAGLHGG
jgi:CheY-like chemotaxis protein